MSGEPPRELDEDDLHRLVDGLLDPSRQAIVEQWLLEHPEDAARAAADRDVRQLLRKRLEPIANEPIPERLRVANLMPRQRATVVRWWPMATAAVICLAIGGVGGWSSRAVLQKEPVFAVRPAEATTQSAVAAFRTYVPEVGHPVEVKADQQTHLVQWLTKRIGEPVIVPDLKAQGFRLMGGRVVPTNGTPASLLMYDDEQGVRLTLYSRVDGADRRTSFRYAREGDVAAFSWMEGDLSYVVTARIDEGRLLAVAEAVDAQIREAAAEKR